MTLAFALLGAFLAVFVRTAAWLSVGPLTGDVMVPPRYRVAVAALIALVLAPLRPPIAIEALPALLPGELLIGVAIGFSVRLVLSGVEAGGQLIGLQLELGFAGVFDPLLREESLPTRRIAYCLGALCFLATGGLESCVRALAYAPSLGSGSPAIIFSRLMDAASVVPLYGLRIAAPTMLATTVANLAVALASRAAPALNVYSVALAAVLVLGGAALAATAPALLRELMLDARYATDLIGRVLK